MTSWASRPGQPLTKPCSAYQTRVASDFKLTAPSRLYWAGRPAMPVVQALHWLHDILPSDHDSILKRVKKILWNYDHGTAIRQDLQNGLDALPGWMRQVVDDLLRKGDAASHTRISGSNLSSSELSGNARVVLKRDRAAALTATRDSSPRGVRAQIIRRVTISRLPICPTTTSHW